MRLDEVFRDLGYLAGQFAAQMRDSVQGVPLEELDLTGAAPTGVKLMGPAHVALAVGEVFRVETEGPGRDDLRFALVQERLGISGGDADTRVRLTLPPLRYLSAAGSGHIDAERIAAGAKVSIAGSGHVEVADVEGGDLTVSIAGSGRLAIDGRCTVLKLSIAGSGSCDGEGLHAQSAAVSIAGSGDAIFGCDGEVSASLMGSGNVIVRGSARCSVHSMGSSTVVCERPHQPSE